MSKIYGAVVGIVRSAPDDLGRVEVFFPWLSDENKSYPARIATFMAGPDRGAWFMPEIDDEVLVVFEHGEIDFPYIIGFLWNGVDRPPTTERRRRLFRSVNGHEIEIYDPPVTAGDTGYIRIRYVDPQRQGVNVIELANGRISITSHGGIILQAPSVIINGRPVAPATAPI